MNIYSIRVLVFLLLMGFCTPVLAQDVAYDTQAQLLLKALSYDKNLTKRSASEVHIVVVHKGSQADADKIAKALSAESKKAIGTTTIKATVVEFSSVAELLKAVKANGFNAIYIHSSLATGLSSMLQVSRAQKIPSLVSSKKLVEQGASFGVFNDGGKPTLMVNLRAFKVEGINPKPALLQIATVMK